MTSRDSETAGKGARTRALLVAAAMDIVHREGIAAVTARRLADQVGLKRQIVHYHFGTIDDVLLEVMQAGFRATRATIEAALADCRPVEVIWQHLSRPTPEGAEFLALALRKPAFGDAMRLFSSDLHQLLADAITQDCEIRGEPAPASPIAVAIITQAVSQALGWEASLGSSTGHDDVRLSLQALFRVPARRNPSGCTRNDTNPPG